MTILVRAADESDFGTILDLYREVDDLHLGFAPHTFRRPEAPLRSRDWLASVLADAQALLLVAEGESGVIGLAEAVLGETKPLPFLVQKRFVTVNTLAVRTGCRRQGVGRALMAAVHAWAEERGAVEVSLTVYDANRAALAFYEALGFLPVKRELRLPVGR